MSEYDYKRLPPFKWFVLENFPFIEADFDALTNWQLFCKLGKEMNKIIHNVNLSGEQVEALTIAFNNLENYVNNYFENLDVQTEINNKLDDMAESGELDDIIAEYLQLQGQFCYNSVAEMKEATNLINGSFAKTYGFYSNGDLGGGIYKIRNVTNIDDVNEINLFALANEDLVAELIPDMPINPLQFGAKNDGETDNTDVYEYIFANYHNVHFLSGTYMVNNLSPIVPLSNSKISLDKDAILKIIPNGSDNYNIININEKENIEISGGTLEGDKATHLTDTGEWGMCISVTDSENITLKNINLINAWGDGLYINDAVNLITENLYIDNCRRNGISVIKANGYHSINDKINGISGTLPEAGIDIEPNLTSDSLKNIIIDNLTTQNCNAEGFIFSLLNLDNTSDAVDITVNNYHDTASTYGIRIKKSETSKGQILINDAMLQNNKLQGIRMTDAEDGALAVYINRPTILNCNTNQSTDSNVSGIAMYLTGTATKGIGNIHITEPYITNAYASARYIVSRGNNNVNNNNISIINPRNNDTKKYITVNQTSNIIFKDEYAQFQLAPIGGSSATLSTLGLYSQFTNNSLITAQNYTLTIAAGLPIGYQIKIINLLTSHTLTVTMSDSEYLKKYSASVSYSKVLSNYNDSITIKKINSTDWIEV